jgi:glycosyltransferase involved in cell wall biosynthesis
MAESEQLNQPLVSVLMSVYNGAAWLQLAINSIVQQDYTNWEFIITDDNSTDESKTILNGYSSDKRFRLLFNNTNKGLTANLIDALKISKGTFIARMDADDISVAQRFSKQVQFLQQNKNAAAVATFIQLINEEGTVTGNWALDRKYNTPSKIKSILPFHNCIAHPSIMIRREIFNTFNYNPLQSHSQDWDLWLQLASANKTIEKINEPLLFYREHAASVTKTSNRKSVFLKKKNFYAAYFKNNNIPFSFYTLKIRAAQIINTIIYMLSLLLQKNRNRR